MTKNNVIKDDSYHTFYKGQRHFNKLNILKEYVNSDINDPDSVKLFYTRVYKRNSDSKTKCTILIMHGFSEHSEKYYDIAAELALQDIEVMMYDQRGFGRSGGIKHFSTFQEVYNDLTTILKNLRSDIPLFILSHSFGSAITNSFINLNPNINISGIILINPFINFSKNLRINFFKKILITFLSNFVKEIFFITPLNLTSLNKNQKLAQEILYDNCNTSYLTFQYVKTFVDIAYYSNINIHKNNINHLFLLGKKDGMSCFETSIEYASKLKNIEINTYEEGLHDLLFDTEKEDCITKILTFIKHTKKSELGKISVKNIANISTIYEKVISSFYRYIIYLIIFLIINKKYNVIQAVLYIIKLKKNNI